MLIGIVSSMYGSDCRAVLTCQWDCERGLRASAANHGSDVVTAQSVQVHLNLFVVAAALPPNSSSRVPSVSLLWDLDPHVGCIRPDSCALSIISKCTVLLPRRGYLKPASIQNNLAVREWESFGHDRTTNSFKWCELSANKRDRIVGICVVRANVRNDGDKGVHGGHRFATCPECSRCRWILHKCGREFCHRESLDAEEIALLVRILTTQVYFGSGISNSHTSSGKVVL